MDLCWLVMNGVPLFEVSKLLRHSSIQMTERYAHLGADHLHNAVANLGFSAHKKELKTVDIFDRAKKFTVLVECLQ